MENIEDKIDKNFPFDKFRDGQREIIKEILESFQTKNYYILEAPTGSGKSVIAYTVAKCLIEDMDLSEYNQPYSVICTNTRMLQLQYIYSFRHLKDISYIWSSQNYDCALYPPETSEDEVHYGDPLCPGKKCIKSDVCGYLEQKESFNSHDIGISNYHYFLNYRKLLPYLTIMDECHNLENLLCDIAAVNISKFGLVKLANNLLKNSKTIKGKDIPLEKFSSDIEKICRSDNIVNDSLLYIEKFFEKFKPVMINLTKELEEAKDLLRNTKSKDLIKEVSKVSKSYLYLKNTIEKYKRFKKSEVKWVASYNDPKKGNLTLKPIHVNEFFDLIAKRTDKILFTSATICGAHQFCKDLGIKDSYNYKEIPSSFPVKNRLVGYKPVGQLNYKNKKTLLPEFVKNIDNIIDYHEKENGLIHSVSYENAEFIKEKSKYKKQILIPDRDQMLNISDIIKEKSKNERIIIVSPSILEGVDLAEELSRFQIFIKVPYGFLGDIWIKTKMNEDSDWYARNAIVKIVQGAGRSIRSKDDYAYTYILDQNFKRLATTNRNLFPYWFFESIRSIKV